MPERASSQRRMYAERTCRKAYLVTGQEHDASQLDRCAREHGRIWAHPSRTHAQTLAFAATSGTSAPQGVPTGTFWPRRTAATRVWAVFLSVWVLLTLTVTTVGACR